MNTRTHRLAQSAGACGLVAIILASTSITSAQVMDTLVKAKALYAEASYDEALAVLKGNDAAEAYQYRALCLMALGRTQEAERSIEALINAAPTYAVSDTDLPPRLVTMFSQTRRRVMPAVVKRLFTEARADFQAKNMASAREKFEKVSTLTHDPAMADSPEIVDLQLLVASYIDITQSSVPVVQAATPVRGATLSAPVLTAPAGFPSATPNAALSSPRTTAPVAGSSTSASTPAAPGAPKPSLVEAAATSAIRRVIPAETIRQNFPPFTAQPGQPTAGLRGAMRITIGVDGKVKAATMEVPIDPRYDQRLITAARQWLYKPATLGGQPIQSEKIVQINIGQE